jgi:hypothetical protein
MAQGVGLEFKAQYLKKEKKNPANYQASYQFTSKN